MLPLKKHGYLIGDGGFDCKGNTLPNGVYMIMDESDDMKTAPATLNWSRSYATAEDWIYRSQQFASLCS